MVTTQITIRSVPDGCRTSSSSSYSDTSCKPFSVYIYTGSKSSDSSIRSGTALTTRMNTVPYVLNTSNVTSLSDGTEMSSLASGATLHIYVTPNSNVYGYCTSNNGQGWGSAYAQAIVGQTSTITLYC
jgi:hypothetical protein